MSDETGSDRGAPAAPEPGGSAPLPPLAPLPPPPPPAPFEPPRPWWAPASAFARAALRTVQAWGRDYFLDRDPTFWSAFAIFSLLAIVLYARWVTTNFIFDEQEALLANPYVNATGGLRYIDAIHRDFWGLLPDRSIGSYRPIPNLLWRAVWQLSKAREGVFRQAFLHHVENVILHGANAALMTVVAFAWTKRRGLAWVAGLIFVACALLTEAVSGIVGIADVLGGMGALLALWALSAPAWAMPFAVFTAVSFGLFSKESALVCVPLIPFAALLVAPLTHPTRPARFARAALAFVAAASAFYLYVELRKKWFPSPLPRDLVEILSPDATWLQEKGHDFLVWFHQAPLPKDPLNNPLAKADMAHRVAGALRVYFRGLVQVVFPRPLSGDYSFRQEPIPDDLLFPESLAGGLAMVAPPLFSLLIWLWALGRERRDRRAAADAGGGLPGNLAGALLGLGGVAVLCVVPALILRDLIRGVPEDEVLEEVPRALLLVTPMIAALAWTGAAALAWLRSRAPWADRGSLRLRVPGLILVVLALWIFGADVFLLRAGGLTISWRGVPVFVGSIPLALLGVGLLVEGAPKIADPFFSPSGAPGPRPLDLTGRLLVALGITWVVVSYFPHSNIPIVLPTVRAERFWYFPVLGSTLVLAVAFTWLHDLEAHLRRRAPQWAPAFFGVFIAFQAIQAYRHAMDYRSDVDFWRATKDAVPFSAKAHLNYSVMKGARGDLETRLVESKIAMELAPDWAMAHIYTGDTLCRMHRAPEAWPHYAAGFAKGPDDMSLIALALQCLYDEKQLTEHEDELRGIAAAHEGSWIAYLATDTLNNHEKNKGVDPKYRPRGYNDGPKE